MTGYLVNIGCILVGLGTGLWAHPFFASLLAKAAAVKTDVETAETDVKKDL